MGEKGRVNGALAILGTVGGLVVYSAINEKFKVPAEMWGVATLAAAYLFSTAKRDGSRGNNEGNEGDGDGAA